MVLCDGSPSKLIHKQPPFPLVHWGSVPSGLFDVSKHMSLLCLKTHDSPLQLGLSSPRCPGPTPLLPAHMSHHWGLPWPPCYIIQHPTPPTAIFCYTLTLIHFSWNNSICRLTLSHQQRRKKFWLLSSLLNFLHWEYYLVYCRGSDSGWMEE